MSLFILTQNERPCNGLKTLIGSGPRRTESVHLEIPDTVRSAAAERPRTRNRTPPGGPVVPVTSLSDDLVGGLLARGLLPAQWRPAFESVPRHLFVPDRFEGGGGALQDRDGDEDGWLRAAYADSPVLEPPGPGEEDAGGPRSWLCSPSLAAELLTAARATQGMQVLEVGSGSGYCAGLLARRLGEDAVTVVERGAAQSERVRVRLASTGLEPRVVTGPGWSEQAPRDRVLSFAPVDRIPCAWIRRCQPGGRILVPWGDVSGQYALADLGVGADGTARGRFSRLRGNGGRHDGAGHWRRLSRSLRPEADLPVRGSELGRAELLDASAAFAAGLLLPGVGRAVRHGSGPVLYLCLVDADTGSWALVRAPVEPGGEGSEVRQKGPRYLADELERAHGLWREAGRPAPDRFGLTVTADRQTAWLDDESTVLHVSPPPRGVEP
ncbi:Protein-L-isoaspartate O-methyltransferase [Nocardiopsis flavescens]|uniref:Protein-L-isoaspartate O-methyltransferase n=1 Tax=Nocardiopsis flavescens TaxID=758803 RepID=A0A1M6EEW9_9ACTN|nr:Protein-L-isoaspartate O-methyltransferase [Nocardiopsis flavescens]